MKRSIVLLIMILAALGLFAQTEPGSDVLTNKRGIAIKPVSGDFAVGIDATPFFRWAGNLFSNNNPYSPSFGFTAQAPGSIFGKYKVSSTTTYRAVLLIGYTSETDKSPNSTDPDMVDKTSASALTIGLTGGIENTGMFSVVSPAIMEPRRVSASIRIMIPAMVITGSWTIRTGMTAQMITRNPVAAQYVLWQADL